MTVVKDPQVCEVRVRDDLECVWGTKTTVLQLLGVNVQAVPGQPVIQGVLVWLGSVTLGGHTLLAGFR